MNRIKTYDATGVAPNGRLYAGDLNLLQDTVAALSDYAQNLAVGTIAIGDSSLSISKYGAGELQVSNMLRTLGVFRAAGGFISGSYTTTARDALVNPPYGLTILNTTTNQYEWNSGTPSVPVWTSLGGGGLTVGLDGAKGAASATNKNKLYFSTDVNGGTLYGSTGSVWQKLAPGLTEAPTIADGSIAAAKLAAGAAAANPVVINPQAASYTAVLADAGKQVEISNAAANTFTIPPNSAQAFPVGTVITILQTGAGQTTITPGAGVTINGNPGLKLNGQWAMASVVKRATDTWVATGNLTP